MTQVSSNIPSSPLLSLLEAGGGCKVGTMSERVQWHFLFTECTVFPDSYNTVGFCLLSLGAAGALGITAAPVVLSTEF